jgi:hypothetical protein
MFAAGLAAITYKKRGAGALGPSSVTCSLEPKIREKRIRRIALGRNRVFPVTLRSCSSIERVNLA